MRHMFDNSTVHMATIDGIASETTNYTATFEMKLGNMPQRGAVWIVPKLASENDLNITFSPSIVALYDNTTSAIVTVVVNNRKAISNKGFILSVQGRITSCDVAFSFGPKPFVRLQVNPVPTRGSSTTTIVAVTVSVLLISFLVLFMVMKHNQEDRPWVVERDELKFATPPVLLGRGTFGYVVLAEWR